MLLAQDCIFPDPTKSNSTVTTVQNFIICMQLIPVSTYCPLQYRLKSSIIEGCSVMILSLNASPLAKSQSNSKARAMYKRQET